VASDTAGMFSITSTDDVTDVVRYSIALFEQHGLRADLPVRLDHDAASAWSTAIADGFTEALALPSASWQHDHLEQIASAFATDDGCEHPHIDVDGAAPAARPAGPYIVLLRADADRDDDLRGLTAPALRRQLGHDRCLTIGEYLVIQRMMFGRHGDHRFDDYTADPSGWMWLADTTVGDRTAMAYWYGPKRRIEITACKTGSKNPRKGARRCRIVPLS
jgi:hypothetical protein